MHRRSWGRPTTLPVPVAQARKRLVPRAARRRGTAVELTNHDTRRPPLVCAVRWQEMSDGRERPDWRLHGVRVVHADELDPNTPQTPGMNRAGAIDTARAGAEKLWAGTVVIHADAKTGAHHHGELESVIYVVSGRARMRWGERLEFLAEAGPGDFIYVPPYVPHQEINASPDSELSCVVVRSGQEPVVVNLDMPAVEENPEEIHWVDDIHKAPESPGDVEVL